MSGNEKKKDTAAAMVGQRLKEAREKKSLSIDQVQKQTRINSMIIRSLEEGRCDQTLTPMYVKSFLKKYADYLGLDSNQLIGQYAVKQAASPVTAVGAVQPPADPVVAKHMPMALRTLVALLACALTIFIVVKTVGFFSRISGASAKKGATAKTRPVGATRRVSRSKTASAVAKSAGSDKKQLASFSIPAAVQLKLVLHVRRSVLVKVRTDGNLIFERVLDGGTSETITAKNRINIYAAKGEAIDLTVNGKIIGPVGTGPIKSIEITRTGVRIK